MIHYTSFYPALPVPSKLGSGMTGLPAIVAAVSGFLVLSLQGAELPAA